MNGSIVLLVSKSSEKPERGGVPIDPDGPRGLKFEGVLSPEPHALCPGLRLSSYFYLHGYLLSQKLLTLAVVLLCTVLNVINFLVRVEVITNELRI